MMAEKLIVFGAGGHGKVVIDAILRQGVHEIAFLADADVKRHGSLVSGYEIRSEAAAFEALGTGVNRAIVAVGHNDVRRHLARIISGKGFSLISIIHPSSIVSPSASIGAGTLVMPGSILNADARIGENVIINTGAVVEHDCDVGDHAHIGPHATLCGGVRVGAGTLVGAGATVLVGVRIGAGAVIGAGSTVLCDVPDGATAVGSPCRILKRNP
jgi:sugar O-acyltransferase (sialic acid O-acetyltransferase NeuD family)